MTTSLRRCPDCGLEEHRTTDEKGRAVVNLSPLTNQCVMCLGKAALARHLFASVKDLTDLPFDARAAAARNNS